LAVVIFIRVEFTPAGRGLEAKKRATKCRAEEIKKGQELERIKDEGNIIKKSAYWQGWQPRGQKGRKW
jgi:hypothetical protein